MRYLYIPFLLFISLLFIACEKTDNENDPEVLQSIINKSLAFFDGEVIEKKLEVEQDEKVWKIKIQNSNGSIVQIYWTENREILLKMKGLDGPFDYEIMPGEKLINFSTARTVAIGSVISNTIEKWQLEQEKDFIGQWVYMFDFEDNGGFLNVYIDAENGNILQID